MEPTAADLREFKRLIASGTTPYIQALFRDEIARLEKLFPSETPAPAAQEKPKVAAVRYESIDSYAFSDGKEKAQVICRGIKSLDQAEVDFQPHDHGFTITINRTKAGLSNMKLTVGPTKKIVPGDSSFRVRNETLTITLAKKKSNTWTSLKKSSLAPKKKGAGAKGGDDDMAGDPNNALMGMMKKMYDEGDDEMKRTMSKAMWEAQHKQGDKDDTKL